MEAVNNITSNNKNDILDPLSIIIKLFLYYYKPIGTKISIGNNRIYIQDGTYIQGLFRRYNGDSKNDINILLCPILYSCMIYLKDSSVRDIYLPIFKVALQALTNMKQTYANTAIIYNIEHIINIVQMFVLEESPNVNNIINPETPLFKIKENIYHHLNTAWTVERKNILFGYVKEILDVNNLILKQTLLDGLCKFMDCMDIFVSNILLNNNSSSSTTI
jgi:hypothetical protein